MYNLPFKENSKIIELGGGEKPMFRPNLDVRNGLNIDIVADLEKELPLLSESWDGIFCQYAIEHISWRNVKNFIKECFRILKPGGTAVFITANLLEQARVITEAESLEEKYVCMIFGDNDYPENSHRCGFSPESAGQLFQEIGFEKTVIIKHPNWRGDMIIEATKSLNEVEAKDLFDKDYFNGGKKVGGYAHEGYRDFPVHWITAQKILEFNPISVLELGCARGYILKRIQDAGVSVGGIEVSDHCFQTRVCNNITKFDLCKTPWPIPDKFFDLCYSMAVLEHIPEQYVDAVISEIDRVSQRGVHGIDLGKNDDGFDKTHFTLKDKEWWEKKFPKTQLVYDKEYFETYEGHIRDHVPEGDGKLKLNIGSFITMFHNGWVNIDCLNLMEFAKSEGYKYLPYDVKNGLPFDDNSVDLMFSSHFLEHLSYEDAKKFLIECHRILKKDAVFRISVPDLELLINKYQNGTISDYDEINDGAFSSQSNAGKFWNLLTPNHLAAYDWRTLEDLAKKTGFVPHLKKFREGNDQILKETLDTLPSISLFVEFVKA